MNLAEWKRQTQENLRSLVKNINKFAPGITYGALASCAILPLVAASKQGQPPFNALWELIGGIGLGVLTDQLQNWHHKTNEELVTDLNKKVTDSEWLELFDNLLYKLDALRVVQTVTSEADKEWLTDTIQNALESIGSRLTADGDIVAVGNITNSTGIVIGKHNTQYITQITNHYGIPPNTIESTSFEVQLRRYLEWVQRRYSRIGLGSITRSKAEARDLTVLDIYTPLRAKSFNGSATGTDYFLFRELFFSNKPDSKEGFRWLILGNQGTGKTAVLQYVACLFALALTQNDRADVEAKLNFTRDALPIPIIIPLRAYTRFYKSIESRESSVRTLAAFLDGYITLQQQGQTHQSPNFFSDLLRSDQHLLLLFDGMDEIADENDFSTIQRLIVNLSIDRPSLHILATCRTSAYETFVSLGAKFQVTELQPMNEQARKELIDKVLNATGSKDENQRKKQATELISIIDRIGTKGNKQFFDTPLMVSLLFLIQVDANHLPRHRAELYWRASETLLRQDYGLTDVSLMPPDDATRLRIQRLLIQLVAWLIHGASEEGALEIDEIDLEEKLFLEIEQVNTERRPWNVLDQPNTQVIEFLEQTRLRGSFLAEDQGYFRFSHFAFQEFMAACYIMVPKN